MASLGSVFDRDILLRTINANPERLTPFWTSGAFNTSGQIGQLVAGGSATFEVPYIMDIDGDLEANYSNEIYTDIAMPRTDWSRHHAGPYGVPERAFHWSTFNQSTSSRRTRFTIDCSTSGWPYGRSNSRIVQCNCNRYSVTLTKQARKHLKPTLQQAQHHWRKPFQRGRFIDVESTMLAGQRGTGAIVVHPKVKAAMEKASMLATDADPALAWTSLVIVAVLLLSLKKAHCPGTQRLHVMFRISWNADSFVAESVRGEAWHDL